MKLLKISAFAATLAISSVVLAGSPGKATQATTPPAPGELVETELLPLFRAALAVQVKSWNQDAWTRLQGMPACAQAEPEKRTRPEEPCLEAGDELVAKKSTDRARIACE